jgi:hypothetical protein
MFEHITGEDYKSEKLLCVRLPIRPRTVGELRLIRFWLHAISDTCFQHVTFYRLFNPEFLELLLPLTYSPSVQFRADELMAFRYNCPLPPLAYGPLIRARAVEFSVNGPFYDLLQLVCTFVVPPRQVEADISGSCSYADREHLLYKVGHPISVLVSNYKNEIE